MTHGKQPPFAKKPLHLLIIVLFLTSFISGCAIRMQPVDAPLQPPAVVPPTEVEQMKLLPVVFVAQLSHFQGAGLNIAVDILDDITGIQRSFTRFPLNAVDEYNFTTTVDLPLYGETRYRYVLLGGSEEVELDGNNKEILFRNVYVTPEIEVHDIILGFPSSPYFGEFGRVEGAVTEDSSDRPISDVMISIAGNIIYTDKTGRFQLINVPVGVHRLTATSVDGAFQVFEQEVSVVGGLSTPAIVKMASLPEVKVTFIVQPPDDAVGAPIRMTGNYYQFGSIYPYSSEGNTTSAIRLPVMDKMPDGRYTLQFTLHAGSELRYKYTMGDGFINAERDEAGNRITRRFIVPSKNTEIKDHIVTWREDNHDPASITVKINAPFPFEDWVSLQLKDDEWLTPFPMWPIGDNRWMYLLYDDPSLFYSFQICRNDLCEITYDLQSHSSPRQIDFLIPDNNYTEVNQWNAWDSTLSIAQSPTGFVEPNGENLRGVEYSPDYLAGYLKRQINIISSLADSGINWLILTPTWNVSLINGIPYFSVDSNSSISLADLASVIAAAKEHGMQVSLYPQLTFDTNPKDWWITSSRDQLWWQQWYIEYERFALNFSIFAESNDVDHLILDGLGVSPSFPGELTTTDKNMGTPASADDVWSKLVTKIKKSFTGLILWTIPVRGGNLPTYSFLDMMDGFYLEANSNTEENATYSIETVSTYMDTTVVSFQAKYGKPFFLGLNSPSLFSHRANQQSSELIVSPFSNEFGIDNVSLDSQTSFYETYLTIWKDRPWIFGISSRGFFTGAELTDFSSSIYGKPAFLSFTQ